MADYNEKSLSGKSWRRAYRLIIENQLDKPQEITYHREDVFRSSDGQDVHRPVDFIQYKFEDQNELITMIDKETGLPTETQYPAGMAAWILYSLFWKLSNEKDNPEPVTEPTS